jgi:hypothetical protein
LGTIYLTNKPEKQSNIDIWAVNPTGLRVNPDESSPGAELAEGEQWYAVEHDIPPSRLRLVRDAYEEEQHPRGEHGRWTAAGGHFAGEHMREEARHRELQWLSAKGPRPLRPLPVGHALMERQFGLAPNIEKHYEVIRVGEEHTHGFGLAPTRVDCWQ